MPDRPAVDEKNEILLLQPTGANSLARLQSCCVPSSGVRTMLRLMFVQALQSVAFYVIVATIGEYVECFFDSAPSGSWSLVWINILLAFSHALSPVYGWITDTKYSHFPVLVGCFIMNVLGVALIFASAYIQDGTSDQIAIGRGLYYSGLLVSVLLAVPGIQATLIPFMLEQLTGGADQKNRHLRAFVSWSYFAVNVGAAIAFGVGGYLQSLRSPNGNTNFGGFAWKYLLGLCAVSLAFIIFVFGKNQYRWFHPRQLSRPSLIAVCHTAWCRKPEREHYDTDILRQHQQEPSTQTEAEEREQNDHIRQLGELVPLMTTMVLYFTIYSQTLSTFVEQGHHLDYESLNKAPIPPWDWPLIFDPISIIITVPLMQWVLKPLFERITGRIIYILPSIRWGMVLAAASCVCASLVDSARLHYCNYKHICTTINNSPLCQCFSQMSASWQVPQYIIMGVSEVLAVVGFMEIVLSRSPREFRCTTFGFFRMIEGMGKLVGALTLIIVQSTKPSWYYKAKHLNSDFNPDSCYLQESRSLVYYYFVILAFAIIFNTIFYMAIEHNYRKYTRYAPLQKK
ncbi:solute carrier family 15 member 4-like [Corticium candelabrum]|uniref:solute carrier family 15 member 4-like n=1 Tax=Corticium candelabrum TaxID=121492 RepID=UPI002E30A100|nr:solute carrier family 15 member 4-like [Corticium candelabrum]